MVFTQFLARLTGKRKLRQPKRSVPASRRRRGWQVEGLEDRRLLTAACISPANVLSVLDAGSVVEGNTGTRTAQFVVALSNPCARTVSVNYSTVSGTATAGSDYVPTRGTVTFVSGVTRVVVPVAILGDVQPELNESFSLNLSSPVGGTIFRAKGTATILNDDPPTASINDVAVTEGDTSTTLANFTVTLSAPTSSTVTIDFATQTGTASTSDYQLTTGRLTWVPGDPLSKTVSVNVYGDKQCEPNETFSVKLTSASNATLGRAVGTGTILDDVDVFASIDDGSVVEGNSGTSVTPLRVKLSCAATRDVTVAYTTTSASALAGQDFATTSGTIVFHPGETAQTLAVATYGDTDAESNEALTVDLFSPVNARLGDGQGQITIINDDPWPEFVVSDVTIREGNAGLTTARFAISLVAGTIPSAGVRIGYATANGTAGAGEDFVSQTGTLQFVPGDKVKYVDLAIVGDVVFEPNEMFLLNINAVGSAALMRDGQGIGTINNDEPVLTGSKPIAVRANAARGGLDWYFDSAGDGGLQEQLKQFGLLGDTPVVGDWNGDGILDMGAVRYNPARGGLDWYLDLNGDGYLAEAVRYFGLWGDQPVVGDWNGDGKSDLGVVRVNSARGGLDWYLDLDGQGNAAERVAYFGLLGDQPVVGDWDGNGSSDFGIVRADNSRGGLDWYLDLDRQGGAAERVSHYGLLGDVPVVGDWNNDGKSDLGVARTRGAFVDLYFDLLGDGNLAEEILPFGLSGDRILSGRI